MAKHDIKKHQKKNNRENINDDTEKQHGLVFIISGPSGVGKDTIVDTIKQREDAQELNFVTPQTYTTRPKRSSDDDNTYIFLSSKEFEDLMFVDMVEYEENYGNMYGMSRTSFKNCIESGGNILKIMDEKGARHMKEIYPNDTITIYLKAPSAKVLEERLKKRGSETAQQFSNRMKANIEEMKSISGFDYVVTSNSIEVTSEIVYTIIKECITNRDDII